jgi:hypothetical protein
MATHIQCIECGRVYPLADADIKLGGNCPSDDCPANNEHPATGTLTLLVRTERGA